MKIYRSLVLLLCCSFMFACASSDESQIRAEQQKAKERVSEQQKNARQADYELKKAVQ